VGTLDRRLLERAEHVYPAEEAIERAGAVDAGGGHVRAMAEASTLPGDRWWWRDWDGVLLPYALTAAAVEHFIDRVRDLSVQPNPAAQYEPSVEHRASVEYTATAVRTSDPEAPFQVDMRVHFRLYCGRLCALSFTHSRTVLFGADREVLRVFGDGPPTYVVS
jgi:hypothetical protein